MSLKKLGLCAFYFDDKLFGNLHTFQNHDVKIITCIRSYFKTTMLVRSLHYKKHSLG